MTSSVVQRVGCAGIAAAERAVQLKPDFPLARGNLEYARAQKLGKAAR